MKILRIVLVVGGLALIGYGFYSGFFAETSEVMESGSSGLNNQVAGMIGVGLLASVAGLFMGRRR
ncbi:hypothetical protein J1N09_14370 [Aureitalea sp. L0-47]|uniref:DUF1700 domain-containing protein n=1 Tax=Aureitalea sp. L0-47 TaxID=2816962 RepID=UPI002238F639|nr:DUF1700 domain-containing protein [Aureitalea sp. L0-47]MCW5521031.1 hypothetical protein [Aureitalea sp. L0-47]